MLFLRLLALIGCVALLFASPIHASPVTLKTAWISEYEAFAAWYAHEQQWDTEQGIALEFEVFPTGKNLVSNMKRSGCVIGACGGAAAIFSILDKQACIIGIGADEAAANAIYVRPDSPLLSIKSSNPRYPHLYGDANTMQGKTILAPAGTSAHQLLYCWLQRLGASDTASILIDTKPEESLKAFVGGMGDAVALWAPDTYKAEKLGLKRLFTGQECGIIQPILLIADNTFTKQHPEQITAFLKAYLKAAEAIGAMPQEKVIPLYQRFMQDFSGKSLSQEAVRNELESHRFLSREEQRSLFQNKDKESSLQTWLEDVIQFHAATGALSLRQVHDLRNSSCIAPQALDALSLH